MPAPVRMTYLGITSIPTPMIEAGEAFGATKRQLLWKVELPAAMPSIMAGLTQCIMLSLSMVVFATLIGAPSLGNPVNKALANRNIPLGIEAGLAIVVVLPRLPSHVTTAMPRTTTTARAAARR